MKFQDIFEASYSGRNIKDLVKHLQSQVDCGEGKYVDDLDGLDEEEIEYYEEDDQFYIEDGQVYKQFTGEDVVWASGDKVYFSIGSDLDDEDMHHYNQLFAKKGFTADKDFEWSVGYGDDMPNGFTISNTKMLVDQNIIDAILDFAGTNCYS